MQTDAISIQKTTQPIPNNDHQIDSLEIDINISNNTDELSLKSSVDTLPFAANNSTLLEDKNPNDTSHLHAKDLELMKIIFANINGLQIETSNKLSNIIEWMDMENIHVLLLQENNTNFDHPLVKRKVSSILYHYDNIKMWFSQTPYNTMNSFKPGGTSVWLRNHSKHLSGSIQDSIGRWTGIKLRYKCRKIALLSVYQPPYASCIRGSTSLLAQQMRWYIDTLSTSQDDNNQEVNQKYIKQKFREDLTTLIQSLQSDEYEIILGGDFNEYEVNHNVLEDIIEKTHMKDVLRAFQLQDIPTYNRGSYQIDKIFCTSNLLHSIDGIELQGYSTPIASDHQPIQVILSNPINNQSKEMGSQRYLLSNNMHSVTKYLNYRYQMLKSLNIFKKIDNMVNQYCDKEEFNQIDQLITKINIKAEKKVRRQIDNGWSPILIQWKEELKQINLQMRQLLRHFERDDSAIKTTITKKKHIIRQFKRYNEQSYKVRHEYMEESILNLESEIPQNVAKIGRLKHLLRVEKVKLAYRTINLQIKKPKRQIHKLQVMNETGSIEEVTNIEEIAQAVATYNMSHFHQAHPTPLSQYQIPKDTTSLFENTEKITTNTNVSLNECVQLLKHRMETGILPSLSYKVDPDVWKRKILKWKEATTTSPSGIHLGHYKALFKPHNKFYEEESEHKTKLDKRQYLQQKAQLQMINLIIEHGFVPSRWKIVHSILLFKDPNNFLLNRTRNINLYEADYNLLLKIKWSESMRLAEKQKVLHPSQFGCRKRKNAHDPVFIENLHHEMSRLTRLQYSQINFDAQACFDRIIPNIAIQVSKKFGVHNKVLQVFKEVLEETKYNVKIGSQVTDKYYCNTSTTPLYGTGQGSGNSPFIWTLISSELIHLYSQLAKGVTYQDPDNLIQSNMFMTAYVDDVNAHLSHNNNTSMQEVQNDIQQNSSLWEKLLYASGGKLSSTKCSYYVNKWNFTAIARPITDLSIPNNIEVITSEDLIIIQAIPADKHHKSLGYLQSIGKSRKTQFEMLAKKIQDSLILMKEMKLNKNHFNLYYKTILTPKIIYTLGLNYVSKSKADHLTLKLLQTSVRKRNYIGSTSKGITLGSSKWGGLQSIDVYIHQGAATLIQLAKASRDIQEKSSLLKITYLWFRYAVGSEFCPWNIKHAHQEQDYCDSIWFTSISKFIHHFHIHIHIDIDWNKTQRQKDEYLMDIATQQGYTQSQLKQINQARLYLKAITLADITDAMGTHIAVTCYEWDSATPINTNVANKGHFPKPNRQTWQMWMRFIKNRTLYKSRKLKTPLGKWTVSSSSIRKQYKHYSDGNAVLERGEDGYLKWDLQTKQKESTTGLLQHFYPTTLTLSGIPLFQKAQIVDNQDDTNEKHNHKRFRFPRKIIVVSDASVHEKQAAFGWIVADEKGCIIHQHSSRIEELNISSYRAEAFGILDAMKFLHHHQQFIQEWIIYCDNKALITRLQSLEDQEIPYEWQDSDMLYEIQKYLLLDGKFEHVKGHQTLENDEGPTEVKLNILADKLANEAIHGKLIQTPLKSPFRILIDNKPIFKVKDIKEHCYAQVSIQFYRSKFTAETFDTIDWKVYHSIVMHYSNVISAMKLFNQVLPTQQHLFITKQSTNPRCPLCKEHKETAKHILKCSKNPENFMQNLSLIKQNSGLQKVSDTKIKIFLLNILNELNDNSHDPNNQAIQSSNNNHHYHHILQGKVLKTFHREMQEKLSHPMTPKSTIPFLISLLNQWCQAWKYRNLNSSHIDYNQHNDQTSRETIQVKNQKMLQYIYSSYDCLSQECQQFLLGSYKKHVSKTSSSIQNWINMHFLACETCIISKQPENTWKHFQRTVLTIDNTWTNDVPSEAPRAVS